MTSNLKLALSALAVLGLLGCGAGAETGGDEGSIELSLTNAPADASCLQVSVAGSRSVAKSLDLTPGMGTSSILIGRLPVGLATVDAKAFGKPCGVVGPSDTPLFISDAPVTVRIDPIAIAKVLLKLLRNGRAMVAVEFESSPGWHDPSRAPVTLAVIGDSPYGAAQIPDFPNLVAHVNADPDVITAVHVGGIKNGSSLCDTSYFQTIWGYFTQFADPLVFTPGDNEWTDCHRSNNGKYNPLERLAVLRQIFYPTVGKAIGGGSKHLLSQATFHGYETFVENTLWMQAGVTFSAVHVVGSNNNLAVWFGDDTTDDKFDDPVARQAEVAARIDATLEWLDLTFQLATDDASAGVVIFMQADTWDVNFAATSPHDGFDAILQRLATLSRAYGKPVLIVQGDSHVYLTDKPLAMGDALHGINFPVPNLTRIVVQGSTTKEWLKLSVDASTPEVFSWSRIMR
jgi:hypothetical protein